MSECLCIYSHRAVDGCDGDVIDLSVHDNVESRTSD